MTCARLTSKTRHRSDPRPNHHPHDRRLDRPHHRRDHLVLKTYFLSNPGQPGVRLSRTPSCLDFMDVTLADEDTNSIPTDDEVKWTILKVLGNWAPRLSPRKLGPSFLGLNLSFP